METPANDHYWYPRLLVKPGSETPRLAQAIIDSACAVIADDALPHSMTFLSHMLRNWKPLFCSPYCFLLDSTLSDLLDVAQGSIFAFGRQV